MDFIMHSSGLIQLESETKNKNKIKQLTWKIAYKKITRKANGWSSETNNRHSKEKGQLEKGKVE
jgi:hypothetical protein